MKKPSIILSLVMVSLLLNSCGINMALFTNKNSNVTHVELSKKNFKVVDKVSGTSTATYYMGFGGMKNTALIDMAMEDLLSKANLNGSSKALINTTTDVHKGGLPFLYSKITVKVSALVIEFTE